MMNHGTDDHSTPPAKGARRPYAPPELLRVDLVLEETLSGNCKLADVCDDPDEPVLLGGS